MLCGKQPVAGFAGSPVVAKDRQRVFGQQGVSVLAPLSLVDANAHLVGIDVGDFEMSGFAGSQSCGVEGGEEGVILESGYRFQNGPNLFLGQHQRELPALF